jgi:hypothetical protein
VLSVPSRLLETTFGKTPFLTLERPNPSAFHTNDPTSPSPSCMGTKNFIERGRCPLLLKLYDLVFGLTHVLLAGRVLHDQLAVTTV